MATELTHAAWVNPAWLKDYACGEYARCVSF